MVGDVIHIKPITDSESRDEQNTRKFQAKYGKRTQIESMFASQVLELVCKFTGSLFWSSWGYY